MKFIEKNNFLKKYNFVNQKKLKTKKKKLFAKLIKKEKV